MIDTSVDYGRWAAEEQEGVGWGVGAWTERPDRPHATLSPQWRGFLPGSIDDRSAYRRVRSASPLRRSQPSRNTGTDSSGDSMGSGARGSQVPGYGRRNVVFPSTSSALPIAVSHLLDPEI